MPTLSHSQIELWTQCAAKWRYLKIDRMQANAQFVMREPRAKKSPPPPQQAAQTTATLWGGAES